LLKRLSFLHCVFWLLCRSQLAVAAWVYVWVLYSNPLVFMSIFVPTKCWGGVVVVVAL
jgi:hypothetical protein